MFSLLVLFQEVFAGNEDNPGRKIEIKVTPSQPAVSLTGLFYRTYTVKNGEKFSIQVIAEDPNGVVAIEPPYLSFAVFPGGETKRELSISSFIGGLAAPLIYNCGLPSPSKCEKQFQFEGKQQAGAYFYDIFITFFKKESFWPFERVKTTIVIKIPSKAISKGETCIDSDGGKNYYEYGDVRTAFRIHFDKCLDSHTLEEQYCDENGTQQTEIHDCAKEDPPKVCDLEKPSCVELSGCKNQCSFGDLECSDSTFRACGQFDQDVCLEWSDPKPYSSSEYIVPINLPTCPFEGDPGIWAKPTECDWTGPRAAKVQIGSGEIRYCEVEIESVPGKKEIGKAVIADFTKSNPGAIFAQKEGKPTSIDLCVIPQCVKEGSKFLSKAKLQSFIPDCPLSTANNLFAVRGDLLVKPRVLLEKVGERSIDWQNTELICNLSSGACQKEKIFDSFDFVTRAKENGYLVAVDPPSRDPGTDGRECLYDPTLPSKFRSDNEDSASDNEDLAYCYSCLQSCKIIRELGGLSLPPTENEKKLICLESSCLKFDTPVGIRDIYFKKGKLKLAINSSSGKFQCGANIGGRENTDEGEVYIYLVFVPWPVNKWIPKSQPIFLNDPRTSIAVPSDICIVAQ